ncbi:MAG: DUF2286 domain-containing protein [Candidatus Methanomethylicaceae archaeon]
MSSQFMVIRAKEGNLVSKARAEGEMKEVVKKIVIEALNLWAVDNADFTVIRDPQYPVTAKAPITKEQYDLYSKYDLQRTTNGSVMFYVPVYIISFDNMYVEDNYLDKEVFVVAPVVDQIAEDVIAELAVESTKQDVTSEEDEGKEEEDTAK